MVTKPLFKDATYFLNKICILPYTEEELDAIGRLGCDMTKHRDFADKYMEALEKKQYLIEEKRRVPFSELNLQLYRTVLQRPDLEQIPTWIVMPEATEHSKTNIKKRLQLALIAAKRHNSGK